MGVGDPIKAREVIVGHLTRQSWQLITGLPE